MHLRETGASIGLFDSRRSVAVKWTLFNAYGLGAPLRVRPTPHGPVWPSDLPLGGEREERKELYHRTLFSAADLRFGWHSDS